jgi:hypothetical protein
MDKSKCCIDKLRRSRTLHGVTIMVLWIAMVASIPPVEFNTAFASSDVQKILPQETIPAASPSNLVRTTMEYAESFVVVLSKADLEKHLHIYTILEQCSSEHARALTSVFLYTQTTSSFL